MQRPWKLAFLLLPAVGLVSLLGVQELRSWGAEGLAHSRAELLSSLDPQFAESRAQLRNVFKKSFLRGEMGDANLGIHIDLPNPYKHAATQMMTSIPAKSPRAKHPTTQLNRVEKLTYQEMKNDPNGITRVKALGKHFADRINGVLASIQKKLDTASREKRAIQLGGLEKVSVKPDRDRRWEAEMKMLDRTIRKHGGTPPKHHKWVWNSRSMRSQERYQNALRAALGKSPDGMGVY